MIDFLVFVGYIFLGMEVTWVFYLALMNLKRNRKKITLPGWIAAGPIYAVGTFVDVVVMNFIIGTLFFLEIPKEFTFTARVQRHKAESWEWRNSVATWFCGHILDPYDPDPAGHC